MAINETGENLSILIQGKFDSSEQAQLILDSYRKLLPKAEIIISCWSEPKLHIRDADKIVYCLDPGPDNTQKYGGRTELNMNRQIVGCREELHISRQYALKVRNDIKITGNAILSLFNNCFEMKQFVEREMEPVFDIKYILKKSYSATHLIFTFVIG